MLTEIEAESFLRILFDHHKNKIIKKLSRKSLTQSRLRRWCSFLPHECHLTQTVSLILEHSILACYSQGVSYIDAVKAAFETLGIPEDLLNFYMINGL